MEKKMLKAEVNLKNYPTILERLVVLVVEEQIEGGKPPEMMGKITCDLMRHLCKVCASTTPMMDQAGKDKYLEMLCKMFRRGLKRTSRSWEKSRSWSPREKRSRI